MPRFDPKLLRDQDFLSGCLLVLIGVGARAMSWNYPLGTMQRPGTGAFPMLISYGLILLGIVLMAGAVVRRGLDVGEMPWRALAGVTAGVLFFQLALERFGLVIAMLGLIVLAALGGKQAGWRELTIFSVILIVGSSLLFVYGLGLPVTVF